MIYFAFVLLSLTVPPGNVSAEPVLLIDDFESGKGWNAVGRARAEPSAEGCRGACLKLTLGEGDGGGTQAAIVQGPNSAAADAWERGPREGLNAFVFHARTSRPTTIHVTLRVRSRTVPGLEGVVGVLQAPVAISGDQWQRYAVRFEDFWGEPKLLPVGDALFREYWPQIQFHLARSTEPESPSVTVWVDELAFGTAEQSSAAELPFRYPGRDRVDEVTTRFAPPAATRAALPASGRASEPLSQQWTFVPWEDSREQFGAPVTVSLPHTWSGRREFVAGWYLRDLEVPQLDGHRMMLQLERVKFFCAAYVNGQPVGEHGGGFTPTEFDLTPAIKTGRNRLAL